MIEIFRIPAFWFKLHINISMNNLPILFLRSWWLYTVRRFSYFRLEREEIFFFGSLKIKISKYTTNQIWNFGNLKAARFLFGCLSSNTENSKTVLRSKKNRRMISTKSPKVNIVNMHGHAILVERYSLNIKQRWLMGEDWPRMLHQKMRYLEYYY